MGSSTQQTGKSKTTTPYAGLNPLAADQTFFLLYLIKFKVLIKFFIDTHSAPAGRESGP